MHELKDLQERVRQVGGLHVTEQRGRAADGRAVRVIVVEADYLKHVGPFPEKHPALLRFEVTVDDRIGLQVESKQEGEVVTTVAHDQPLPDRLFTWNPPAGTQVVEIGDRLGERLGRTLVSVQNDRHRLTVHAVDLAANGDIWVTTSWKFRDASLNNWGTTLLMGDVTDDRGRVYLWFTAIGGGKLGPTGQVTGYTPRDPPRADDPGPKSLSLHHYGSPPLVVPVPPPAAWTRPPMDPMSIAHPERDTPFFARDRTQTRSRAAK